MTDNAPRVGQSASVSRVITESDVEAFADLSLDRNLIHFDDDYAAKTFFGKRIAHGMLGAALISGALTELMGAGNIWLSTSVRFQKPVFINDELTCVLSIKEIDRRVVAEIDVAVSNAAGEVIISGTVSSMRAAPGR